MRGMRRIEAKIESRQSEREKEREVKERGVLLGSQDIRVRGKGLGGGRGQERWCSGGERARGRRALLAGSAERGESDWRAATGGERLTCQKVQVRGSSDRCPADQRASEPAIWRNPCEKPQERQEGARAKQVPAILRLQTATLQNNSEPLNALHLALP